MSDIEKIEARNVSKLEDIIINKSSIFRFMVTQTLPTLCNGNVINRELVTLIKVLEKLNFFKRSTNDLSFTYKHITKKNFLQT